jgi:hypothetical protein
MNFRALWRDTEFNVASGPGEAPGRFIKLNQLSGTAAP